MAEQSAEYVLGGTDIERQRLLAQVEGLEPQARWLLDAVGVQPGWRAVDIGCGPLGIINLLSERVGPLGAVVGLERESRFVEMAKSEIARRNLRNVEIVQADALLTGLEKDSFDLAHERLVLVNVPERDAFISEMLSLGRVDGFDQDEAEGERDEGTVIARSLLATKGDALEALEFADGLLDARPRFVEDFREESGSVGCSRAMRNDRTNAALAGAVAIGFGVVTFVGDGGARQNIRSDVEQEFEVAAVAGFAPGQMEGERQAVEVDLEVDFG